MESHASSAKGVSEVDVSARVVVKGRGGGAPAGVMGASGGRGEL